MLSCFMFCVTKLQCKQIRTLYLYPIYLYPTIYPIPYTLSRHTIPIPYPTLPDTTKRSACAALHRLTLHTWHTSDIVIISWRVWIKFHVWCSQQSQIITNCELKVTSPTPNCFKFYGVKDHFFQTMVQKCFIKSQNINKKKRLERDMIFRYIIEWICWMRKSDHF